MRLTARDREPVGATDRFEARLRQLDVVDRLRARARRLLASNGPSAGLPR